jgi:hypothetical protein
VSAQLEGRVPSATSTVLCSPPRVIVRVIWSPGARPERPGRFPAARSRERPSGSQTAESALSNGRVAVAQRLQRQHMRAAFLQARNRRRPVGTTVDFDRPHVRVEVLQPCGRDGPGRRAPAATVGGQLAESLWLPLVVLNDAAGHEVRREVRADATSSCWTSSYPGDLGETMLRSVSRSPIGATRRRGPGPC